MAAADEAVIGCMPSPCVGELGAGMKKKSSAAPTLLDTLDKVHVLRYVCRGKNNFKFFLPTSIKQGQGDTLL